MKMSTPVVFALFAGALTLASCDPGLNGDMRVYNHTDSVITVHVKEYMRDETYTIPPDSSKVVDVMGGLGNQRTFSCCPCEVDTIYISTSTGIISKDVSKKENWTIPNKAKQKRFGGEDLKCEFHIMPADL